MPTNEVLLVVAMRELGMRSMLAGRLALIGADVMTAEDVDDPVLDRAVRRRAVLIVEEAMVASHGTNWIETLLADPRWHCIVLLGSAAASPALGGDPRVIRLGLADAASTIAGLLPRWNAEQGDCAS